MLDLKHDNANALYLHLLNELVRTSSRAAPRGMPIYEHIGVRLVLTNVHNSVITWPTRKLNYHFMVAEALWIMLGRDDTEMIGHYCNDISKFSDDGRTFFGAYGPPLLAQLPYVKAKLCDDPDSRQAVVTLWRQNPPATKDVPCTIAIQFLVRDNKLHGIFTMRSSDAWLGIPYDVFNFSLIINALAGELGLATGSLMMQLGSSHLYERNKAAANELLKNTVMHQMPAAPPPKIVVPALPCWPPSTMNDYESIAREHGACSTWHPTWGQFVEVLAHRKNNQQVVLGFMRELFHGKTF
jgi:thymidylate synthase